MEINDRILEYEETVALSLRELYRKNGYEPYKMSKFEPYDLYAQNRSFVVGDNILAFTDTNGRLMALKPDVTLSIIKNYKKGQQKVYYDEKVYREGGASHEFTEIKQVGLECIGSIDIFSQCEVLMLAQKSLQSISDKFILDIASVGVINGLIGETPADGEVKKSLMELLKSKNVHNMAELCGTAGVPEEISGIWQCLAALYGPADTVLPQIEELCINDEMKNACRELWDICGAVKKSGGAPINIDFSIISGLDYYNGVVFKGYVEGVNTGILSGGRYDNLVKKLGKNAGAVGFAVYLDRLNQLPAGKKGLDADVLIKYGPECEVPAVLKRAEELRCEGLTVRVVPDGEIFGDYGRIIKLLCEE